MDGNLAPSASLMSGESENKLDVIGDLHSITLGPVTVNQKSRGSKNKADDRPYYLQRGGKSFKNMAIDHASKVPSAILTQRATSIFLLSRQ